MNEDFAKNLRLLCSYYKSIAEVCRRININRPQFNRYLSGRHKPSPNILRRMCDFFGLEDFEILLPHDQFERLLSVQRRFDDSTKPDTPDTKILNELSNKGTSELEKYLGFYFEYYISMAYPGMILRTLVCFEKRDNRIFYQRTERLSEQPHKKVFHGVYQGVAHFLTDRLFLIDYESLTGYEMTQTILYPSFKNRITRLTGLKLGVSGSGERAPCCARVLYEFLGRSIEIRKALKLCGLINPKDNTVDTSIVQAVSNDMTENDWHFRARF
ncbi:helix-turn-helix domain-containing protein [Aliikangiella coralliicola]|uniref:Helix-turn-helix transcriptional regulator n=1 Tax=Aliikangiella coralliicola TaxID=2592383 RepID=A0A545U4J3_9GAMM|nr:helix-turn-helix transcriptional regulator [Aliikangiella coralliicola]TQV84389.1 helix-turn-helix transcriptional regulator [Aliikangiella coralliicola]